jgi:hypothetical protein
MVSDPKFIVTLIVIAAATLMLGAGGVTPHLTGAEWVGAVTWTVSAYMLGQAAGIFATGYAASVSAKASPPAGSSTQKT